MHLTSYKESWKNNKTKISVVSSIQFNMTFKETYFIVTKYSSLGYLLRIYVLLCARLFLISCRVILILIYRYKKTKKDTELLSYCILSINLYVLSIENYKLKAIKTTEIHKLNCPTFIDRTLYEDVDYTCVCTLIFTFVLHNHAMFN